MHLFGVGVFFVFFFFFQKSCEQGIWFLALQTPRRSLLTSSREMNTDGLARGKDRTRSGHAARGSNGGRAVEGAGRQLLEAAA